MSSLRDFSIRTRFLIVMALVTASVLFLGLWAPGSAQGVSWGRIGVAVGTLVVVNPFLWMLLKSISEPLQQASDLAEHIAQGDLSQDVRIWGNDETAALLRSIQTMQTSLQRVVGQVRESAESIEVASAEVATGNQDLSSRTEQAASNLQSTASSMHDLTGTVTQSADAARQANQLASSAAEVAQRGGSVVSQVVSTMEDINTSSKKIADIISVIDGIAFQTNILALNAAVEAARAGEQGRGFAVVASEVRSLAGRSADAAKEIKALIGASVEKVEAGSKLVQDAGSTMTEIVASVQRVTDIIGEISAAAVEQSEGIAGVNGSINQLDQMTQQNAALVEESTAAAESLKDQAAMLTRVVSAFRLRHESRSYGSSSASYSSSSSARSTSTSAKSPKPVRAPARAMAAAPAPAPKAPADGSSNSSGSQMASDATEEWGTF